MELVTVHLYGDHRFGIGEIESRDDPTTFVDNGMLPDRWRQLGVSQHLLEAHFKRTLSRS
jgi:hypothetical protein